MHLTFGASCGNPCAIAKVKWNRPPLYIPSSGSIVSVKLSVSSGSGKSVFMVLGRDSSERSMLKLVIAGGYRLDKVILPF